MTQAKQIPQVPLGRTHIKVSRLGYGSMGLRGPRTWGVRVVDEARAEEFLNQVIDAGINFIDTAPDYGIAEERIGRYLGHRREQFYIATKCGCDYVQHQDHLEIKHTWQPQVIHRNLETSLQRLNTDYLDLLQFHGGSAETLEQTGLLDLLLDLKSQGVIRAIGVSSKNPELQQLIDLEVFDVFQVPYSCLAPEHHELITRAADKGAGIIIRGGIAQGGPDAEIQRPPLNQIWSAAGLDELLTEQISRAELILRYTLSHPHCHTTIVGTCNPDHFDENIASTLKGPLPVELQAEISRRVGQALASK